MKKHSMIMALVLALTMGFVFIGCGGNLGQVDATGDWTVDPPGDDWEPPEGAFAITITPNEYSPDAANNKGLQLKFTFKDINEAAGLSLEALAAGTYTLAMTFVSPVNVDPSDDGALTFAMVGTSPPSYWKDDIGTWSEASGDGVTADDKLLKVAEVAKFTPVTVGGKYTISGETNATDLTNSNLVLEMPGQKWTKPVTLYVTSFSLVKS